MNPRSGEIWRDLETGREERREGKRGERKDQQEAILILKKLYPSKIPISRLWRSTMLPV